MSTIDFKNNEVEIVEGNEDLTGKQLDFINDVFKSEDCPLFIFGGYADDILLNEGKVSRKHSDIDFAAKESDKEAIKKYLEDLGCHVEEFGEENQEINKLKIKRGDIEAEVNLFKWDVNKNRPFLERTVQNRKERGYFDSGCFNYPKQLLNGVEVKVISPLMLLQSSQGYEGDSSRGNSERLQKIEAKYGISDPNMVMETLGES